MWTILASHKEPILKEGVDLSKMPKVDNYGMRFVQNWKERLDKSMMR